MLPGGETPNIPLLYLISILAFAVNTGDSECFANRAEPENATSLAFSWTSLVKGLWKKEVELVWHSEIFVSSEYSVGNWTPVSALRERVDHQRCWRTKLSRSFSTISSALGMTSNGITIPRGRNPRARRWQRYIKLFIYPCKSYCSFAHFRFCFTN